MKPEHRPRRHAAAAVGTLLGVWAHPDDEAYLSAGLMAVARDAGARVVVATATRGERGTADPDGWPPERLAPVRERETAASLAAVGVTDHRWLGHRDGQLPDVPADVGVTQVRRLIEEVRPDTVVTFGPDGMTGHPDHRTVSGWVTEAWHQLGCPGRLWYATLTPQFHAEWGELNSAMSLWLDGSPPSTPPDELALELHCEGHVLDRKMAALRAHASQTAELARAVGDRYRDWWSREAFVPARAAVA